MQDRIGIVADQLTQGYLETCEIHDALIRGGMTEEDAYLTYVGAKMVYHARKEAFEAKRAERPITKPTIKLKAVNPLLRAAGISQETPEEFAPVPVCDRNDPPPLD